MKAAVVVAMLIARVALADPDQASIDRARVSFEHGKALYDAGDYKRAVDEYLAAYRAAPFPELLFNIGQAYRLSGNDEEALKSYEMFLQQQSTGSLAAEANAHVIELRKRIAEKPKTDAYTEFNKNLVLDKAAEVDMRPEFSFGARLSLIDDGKVYAAHASYIKRLGRYVALAPRVQLGLSTISYEESTISPGGTVFADRTAVGVVAEVQLRVVFPLKPWFFLGTGVSLGYISAADRERVSDTDPTMPDGTKSVGAVTYPLVAEAGFVIQDHYEIGLQIMPLGFVSDDFISNGDQFISVFGGYRFR